MKNNVLKFEYYQKLLEKFHLTTLSIFPIIYIITIILTIISGTHQHFIILYSKIITAIITFINFLLSFFIKSFRKKYMVYAVYFLMFMIVFNSAITIILSETILPLHIMITGCVMILNTYVFITLSWLIPFTIFSLIMTYFYFLTYFNDHIKALFSTIVISCLFIFVFMFYKIRKILNLTLNNDIKDIHNNIKLEKDYAKKLNEFTSLYEGMFNSAPIQMAILNPKSLTYEKINDRAFPPELKNYITGKDDDQYCNYIGIDQMIAHNRIKHMLKVKKTKESICYNEKIMFINGNESIYQRYYSPIINEKGNITHILMMGKDITDDIKLKEQMKQKLMYDNITKVYNREYIEQFIESNILNNKYFSIMFIDIDNFKQINDTLGHDYGDKVLKIISTFFKDNLHLNDKIGRLGGDEFIILFNNLHDKAIIKNKVTELYNKFLNNNYKITLSMGISIYPFDAKNKSTLLKKADQAMYISKQDKSKNAFTLFSEIN